MGHCAAMKIHHKVAKGSKENDGRFAQDERSFMLLRVLCAFVVNLSARICVNASIVQGSKLGRVEVAAGVG